jgi:hypothetical protein
MINKSLPVLLLASLGFVLITGCVTVAQTGDIEHIVGKVILNDQVAKDLNKVMRTKAKAELKKSESLKSAEKQNMAVTKGYIPWE